MLTRWILLGAVSAALAAGQDAESGISIPMTLSAGGMYTQRLQLEGPDSPVTGGFRAVLRPTIRLGSHWFAYGALQVRLAPYFYYDAFDPDHDIYTDVLQAFIGYSLRRGNTAMVVKAGRLSSAFGAFPSRYDDADNPLLDQPLGYITEIPLRADQIPCGTTDLRSQYYGYVWNACGGAPGGGAGLVPVTVYSLPGIEMDLSAARFDARLQVTAGSPASPQSLSAAGTYAQWTAGAGYTIRQGFRVGVSGFRGPYLDHSLTPLLPTGTTVRSFPASGFGADAQWARGRWSINGEFQRFWFDSPNFAVSPSMTSGYFETKRVLTPRLYLAMRAGWLASGSVLDKSGVSANQFSPTLQSYEFGAGSWLGRNELIKASYEILHAEGSSGTRDNVLGFQFVVRVNSLAWAFR